MSPSKCQYDDDFYRWTQTQAALLREEKAADLDYINLAEEIESLGKRDRRELSNRLERLLQHLLKWRYQPERRMQDRSWERTIREQRRRLELLLADSPSLRREVPMFVEAAYPHARVLAFAETRLPESVLPATCPWTVDQVLGEDFWPDAN